MGLFGKPKLAAEQAGVQFMHDCLEISRERWPLLSGELRPILAPYVEDIDAFLADNWTSFYFALAAIACDMRAARNLLPPETSARALNAAYDVLVRTPELGELVTDLIDNVDAAWDDAIASGEMPSAAVPLLEALDVAPTITVGDAEMYDPIALMAVDGVVLRLVPGWWKAATSKFQIR